MKFQKGHTLSRGKRKPGGGRKKTPSTIMAEAITNAQDKAGDVMNQLLALAINEKDREALIHVSNMIHGRPKASTEIDITGGEQLGAGTVKMIMIATQEYQKKLREGQHIEGEVVNTPEDIPFSFP